MWARQIYSVVFFVWSENHLLSRWFQGASSVVIKKPHYMIARYANSKYRYGNRKFWCRGYYIDTVGRNKKRIEE